MSASTSILACSTSGWRSRNADMLALLDRHPLVLHAKIGVLEPKRDPAEPRFGEEDFQLRKALEHAGEDQLSDADGGRQTKIANPFEERTAQALDDLGDLLRVTECRLRGARPGAVERYMHRYRHFHVDCRGPELVVLRRRIPFGIGQCAQLDAFQAELLAVCHLG